MAGEAVSNYCSNSANPSACCKLDTTPARNVGSNEAVDFTPDVSYCMSRFALLGYCHTYLW